MTTIESTRQRYAALNQARRREATPILDNETMLEFLISNRDRAVLEGCLNLSNREPVEIAVRTAARRIVIEQQITIAPGLTITRPTVVIRSSSKFWIEQQQAFQPTIQQEAESNV
ncbi:MAG TPA: hypothetical protein VIL10_10705 [Marmoricola sp.]|jgi:hypothetical protein